MSFICKKDLIPLSREKILNALLPETPAIDDYHIDIFENIDSTNDYLKKHYASFPLKKTFILAEKQCNGHGRQGKPWFSPAFKNIYLSHLWRFNMPLSKLNGLSLAISLAILQTLELTDINHALTVKWPNDIYWFQRKIAGCLIELGQDTQNNYAIIGIGININLKHEDPKLHDVLWTSLARETQQTYDRNLLVAKLISHLTQILETYEKSGFQPFRDMWQQFDYLQDKYIRVHHQNKIISGQYLGIDDQGYCQLLQQDGKIITIQSGSIDVLT